MNTFKSGIRTMIRYPLDILRAIRHASEIVSQSLPDPNNSVSFPSMTYSFVPLVHNDSPPIELISEEDAYEYFRKNADIDANKTVSGLTITTEHLPRLYQKTDGGIGLMSVTDVIVEHSDSDDAFCTECVSEREAMDVIATICGVKRTQSTLKNTEIEAERSEELENEEEEYAENHYNVKEL